MKTILVVDDEPTITELVRDYLHHAGFRVLTAGDGPHGAGARPQRPPGPCRPRPGPAGSGRARRHGAVRRDSDVPIIVVSARDEEPDRLVGLELGSSRGRSCWTRLTASPESYERAVDAHIKNIRRKLEPGWGACATRRRSAGGCSPTSRMSCAPR